MGITNMDDGSVFMDSTSTVITDGSASALIVFPWSGSLYMRLKEEGVVVCFAKERSETLEAYS